MIRIKGATKHQQDNKSFSSCESHMLLIIKSLQDELLRVTRERDEYLRLLHECTDQISGIITSHEPKILIASSSRSSSSSSSPVH